MYVGLHDCSVSLVLSLNQTVKPKAVSHRHHHHRPHIRTLHSLHPRLHQSRQQPYLDQEYLL